MIIQAIQDDNDIVIFTEADWVKVENEKHTVAFTKRGHTQIRRITLLPGLTVHIFDAGVMLTKIELEID